MMELIFLGTGGAQPTLERSTTCICLVRDGEILMFDAGEGAQISYLKSNLRLEQKNENFCYTFARRSLYWNFRILANNDFAK